MVVEFGCGSGRWAGELNRAGYEVLGIDQSSATIGLARRIAPASRFKVASLFDADLPSCVAVTSIGECLNYCLAGRSSRRTLTRLFQRAYHALDPGGVLIFDVAGPNRASTDVIRGSEGRDWAVISRTTLERRDLLRRRITAFRKAGKLYRRSEEIHDLRLYAVEDLAEELTACGFRVRVLRGYGQFRLPAGIEGILAIKP